VAVGVITCVSQTMPVKITFGKERERALFAEKLFGSFMAFHV
jgi:hypothetical protein